MSTSSSQSTAETSSSSVEIDPNISYPDSKEKGLKRSKFFHDSDIPKKVQKMDAVMTTLFNSVEKLEARIKSQEACLTSKINELETKLNGYKHHYQSNL